LNIAVSKSFKLWGFDDLVVQAPTTKVKANIPSYASMVGDTPKLTKTISESCKRPESKPKPQHQSKPPTKQQSSSYGKSGFRGLQPYPHALMCT